MTKLAAIVDTTSMRGRVAIANICVTAVLLAEPAAPKSAFSLREFYWEFVEQDTMTWFDRRRSFEPLDLLDALPTGLLGRCLDVADSAAMDYLFCGFPPAADHLCTELGDLFADVHPASAELLRSLCAVSARDDRSKRSRREYLSLWERYWQAR